MSQTESVRMQLNDVEMRRSSVRQTPITSFGTIMRRGLVTGLNTAGYALPGAAVVGAAISGIGMTRDAENPLASGYLAGAGWENGGLGGGGSMSEAGDPMQAVTKRAAGGDQQAQMMLATQRMQEANNSMNMQYLQMQQSMQDDSRKFTLISNIMKMKHDTARNSLSNLK